MESLQLDSELESYPFTSLLETGSEFIEGNPPNCVDLSSYCTLESASKEDFDLFIEETFVFANNWYQIEKSKKVEKTRLKRLKNMQQQNMCMYIYIYLLL